MKQVRLAWEGRAFEAGRLSVAANEPAIEERGPEDAEKTGVTIVRGDALPTADYLHRAGVRADLVYVDPPYASQTDYSFEARLEGSATGRKRRGIAYGDRWRQKQGGIGAYLDEMAPRLEAMARLLRPTGTLWVHLDWRAAYLVRVVVEEILGREAFLNEIVWRRAPNLGRQAASSQFGRTLDTILVFGGPEARLTPPTRLEKIAASAVRIDDEGRPFTTAPRGDYTDASIARLEKEGRVHRSPSGKVYIKYFLEKHGDEHYRARRVDTLWTDVPPLRHAAKSERTGYPTQKPLALLERIIACAAPPGGTVVDLFGGSGTTAEAAARLGRHAFTSDQSPVAIATIRARLLRGGFEPTLLAFEPPKPGSARKGGFAFGVKRRGGAVEVTLDSKGQDGGAPLAWAIAAGAEDPYTRVFHAERTTEGALERVARVPDVPILRIRVFADDGTVYEEKVQR